MHGSFNGTRSGTPTVAQLVYIPHYFHHSLIFPTCFNLQNFINISDLSKHYIYCCMY